MVFLQVLQFFPASNVPLMFHTLIHMLPLKKEEGRDLGKFQKAKNFRKQGTLIKILLSFFISFERKFVLCDSIEFGHVGVLPANVSVERISRTKTTVPANTTHEDVDQ